MLTFSTISFPSLILSISREVSIMLIVQPVLRDQALSFSACVTRRLSCSLSCSISSFSASDIGIFFFSFLIPRRLRNSATSTSFTIRSHRCFLSPRYNNLVRVKSRRSILEIQCQAVQKGILRASSLEMVTKSRIITRSDVESTPVQSLDNLSIRDSEDSRRARIDLESV